MLVKLSPHPEQIRYYAQGALNAFKTLDADTAIEIAIAELKSLLSYLDRADDTETVLGVRAVESGVGSEARVGDAKPGHAPNLEIVRS
ncbi:conserved protein of unknown function [Candidatus Filomicrobium marinum]|uniref:Uncharacterized protein n=1 Tax=Candidatus Filomicrobium marinum TaxID=1608628 RepID=A0A0D6JCU8_9HYPH|nr:hypothetical protein [Candidatus Filomicrobium marinum]CFX06908.1 conserved protein of unknown function [Candidatus Filomicrobium marinum]CPR16513.1 conserved protein of unknown function [Candidatus Filomicrobium marinum]